ncbi:MAG: hypothetical protein HYU58_00155 [Proteobacteria bacterium]|nr:hypothetical protein [Pseudomonadota bacterium]
MIVSFSLALALLTSCVAPVGEQESGLGIDLKMRLVAANLLAGSLAVGLNSAVRAQVIAPGSDRALLIKVTLDAVEQSLDGASVALRTGLPELAVRQIGAAESQLDGLQPLLPASTGTEPMGDLP